MFAWSATSILVIFIINKNRVLFVGLFGLMASGINDQDLLSDARRFDECKRCGEVVRMRQEKLVCLECGLLFHRSFSNLDHK